MSLSLARTPLEKPAARQAARPAEPPLRPVGAAHQTVRFLCASPLRIDDAVVAYVNGVKVGEHYLRGDLRVGASVEFPIRYLPFVDLPAEIRFARARDGAEIAAPLPIKTRDDAVRLVGLGDIAIENLAIERGVARGLAVNRVNGLVKPELFARINGVVPRMASVDQHRLLDDGGASFQFAVRLEPDDLGDSGLSVEIFAVGRDSPLSSIVYRRADESDLTRKMLQIESRLDQSQQAAGYQLQCLDNELTARIGLLQDRIDSFIEYAASLLFDRVAATEVAQAPGESALDEEKRRKMAAFLALIRNGAKAKGDAAAEGAAEAERRSVPLRSSGFSQGWHDVETDDGDDFRWMSSEGIIFNPEPGRPVREIEIGVYGVYGAELPMLRCFFDGAPGKVLRDASAGDGAMRLRAIAPSGSNPRGCDIVRIESMVSASPASLEGASDQRLLSIAVSEVSFVYA